MTNQYMVVVKSGNEIKISQYGPSNGNPAYAGMDILDFLKTNSMEHFRRMLRGVKAYSLDKSEEARRNRLPIYTLGTKVLTEVIEGNLSHVVIETNFRNSNFCDYVYIIDLDGGTFMVRKGAEASYPLRALPGMDEFLSDCGDEY